MTVYNLESFSHIELSRVLCYQLYRNFETLKVDKILLNSSLMDFNIRDFLSVSKLKETLLKYPLDTIDFYIDDEIKTIDVASIESVSVSSNNLEVCCARTKICLCRC